LLAGELVGAWSGVDLGALCEGEGYVFEAVGAVVQTLFWGFARDCLEVSGGSDYQSLRRTVIGVDLDVVDALHEQLVVDELGIGLLFVHPAYNKKL
jgi:hypothetical protein